MITRNGLTLLRSLSKDKQKFKSKNISFSAIFYMGKIKPDFSSWHVSVAAEAITAAQFARLGYDVSVQYGANQPEYDLMIAKLDEVLKVSVKGSKDGSWGLTQSLLEKGTANYHGSIEKWLEKHEKKRIVFCLVQFKGSELNDMPRIYLATPNEIADQLKISSKGKGGSILYENHIWTKAAFGYGTIEKIPENWKFSSERIIDLLTKLQPKTSV